MFPEICEATVPRFSSSSFSSKTTETKPETTKRGDDAAEALAASVDLDIPHKTLRRVRIWFGSDVAAGLPFTVTHQSEERGDNFEPWYVSTRCGFINHNNMLLERLVKAQFCVFEGDLFAEVCVSCCCFFYIQQNI